MQYLLMADFVAKVVLRHLSAYDPPPKSSTSFCYLAESPLMSAFPRKRRLTRLTKSMKEGSSSARLLWAGRQHRLIQQLGKTTMATYVVLARFTDQGVKNAKESPKRAEAFRQMAETFGVTVKDIFWTQGRYDIVIVIEAPDELSATALNLSLSALGNIRTESLRAFSSTDMLKIVAKML
jgi:uncharacterized protein with GYD domain